MNSIQCSKGHWYDPRVTDVCPQCAAEQALEEGFQEEIGATVPVFEDDYEAAPDAGAIESDYSGNIFGTEEDRGKSLSSMQGNGFKTSAFTGRSSRAEEYDDVTQPVMLGTDTAGFSPVTGWLVCVDGPAKGSDYRVRAGYNYIGRAAHMDICIAGDNRIGRERHAMIAYDLEEKVFFFGPSDGKSIVRLNGKMVMVPTELHDHDIITIGSTKLMFVPLCGERFNWDV